MAQLESFFWGIIAALGALILELIFFIVFSFYIPSSNISFDLLFTIPQFIIIGACIEEIFKYIIISKRIEMLSLGKSYLVNSFFVGLGFFSVELGLIWVAASTFQINLLSEIAIIHMGTAGFIGYIVATMNPKKITTFISAIAVATLFHALYNLMVLDRTFILNYAIFFLIGIIIFFNVINIFRINSKLAQD
ncbi:MAG: hypothetical protein ACD_9C00215G0003 [uncultured bacterium]|nr:MAG: hypothetical protein ACD_9C00215G0003 [uncultured bacterium]